MKGKKRLTQCEQKALVALKAEEIQEKARKAKTREKKREMSTAKVRTALGGQQMSFQPQPQVETAPLRYQPQQQERSRLSDPWIGFGQNVALTLLNYGLMHAGRHQDRQMLAAMQQQKQQEKSVFKPEYKDVSFTDLKKGFGEISALKKRKIETITQPAAGFQTPNKKNQSERKKVVAVKSSGAGGLFDKFIGRSTQSTQTGSTQTQEFGTQTETEQDRRNALALKIQQDRRNAIDAMGFEELLIALGEDTLHPDDKEYATNRADTLRTRLFAQNEKGQHFLETNTKEQNKIFFDQSYRGGYIGSPANTRGNVDPETGQTFIIVDGHRLNRDGSYELHPAGVLVQQEPDEAMAILKAVRENKLEQLVKGRELKEGFQAFANNRLDAQRREKLDAERRGPVKGPIQMANPSELEGDEQKTMDQWYNQNDTRPGFHSNRVLDDERKGPTKTTTTMQSQSPSTADKYINQIKGLTGYTGVLPKLWLNIAKSVNLPTGDDLTKVRGAPVNMWYNQDDEPLEIEESKMGDKPPPKNATSLSAPLSDEELNDRLNRNITNITPVKPINKKPDITPPPSEGYDPKKLIQALTNTVNTPSSSSLNQSPSVYGFYGPTAYPGTLDENVKGFYNKILLKAKGGTPASFFMGRSPSSLMTPQTQTPSDVEMSSIITDRGINEPPKMQPFEVEDNDEEEEEDNDEEEDEFENFGAGYDNENIEDEMENVGPSFID
jgi:hypothetical protein